MCDKCTKKYDLHVNPGAAITVCYGTCSWCKEDENRTMIPLRDLYTRNRTRADNILLPTIPAKVYKKKRR